MRRPWADACLVPPAHSRAGSHIMAGTPGPGRKTLSWTPPCWGRCIYFHKALPVTLDFTPGSDLFASSGWILLCFVPSRYSCTDIGGSPPTFLELLHNTMFSGGDQCYSRWGWLDAPCPRVFWGGLVWYKALQLLKTWVWLSWQCLP